MRFSSARSSVSGDAPEGISQLLLGDREIGEVLVDSPKVPVVSATGSTRMAAKSARAWPSVLRARSSNSAATMPVSSARSADLDMALRAIAFGAMGTAGQRCTTLRRLFVHESVYDALVPRLQKAYASVSVWLAA
ncbi:aldehyde dehydrogenase family protein [Brucella abortus]|nr:aldehyde dehydrogenase family protein [Brucella abortus]